MSIVPAQSLVPSPQSPPPPGWLPSARAARLLGRTVRTIQRWCEAGELTARLVDGDWYVDPTSSPALAVAVAAEAPLAMAADSPLAGMPAAHRERMRQRVDTIESYLSASEDRPLGMTAVRWQQAWCDAWNQVQRQAGHAELATLRPRTLRQYLAKYRQGGAVALADGRARNGGAATISPEAGTFIMGMWCDQNQPRGIPEIYELACAMAQREGWQLPGLRAVQMWVARQDRKLILAGREPKKFRDRCVPSIVRDPISVHSMECVVGDHHQFDFMWPRQVWVEDAGKLQGTRGRGHVEWRWFRPWLSAWLDVRSWFCFGSTLAFDSPDGDRVMGSFIGGVSEHGIPEHLYLDNGKDYRCRQFAGGRRVFAAQGEKIVAERAIKPVTELLSMDVTWAIPYNAKAKWIEPWFRLVEQHFGKRFASYVGNKPERRPERAKLMGLRGAAEAYARELFTDETHDRLAQYHDRADQGLRDELCLAPLRRLWRTWLQEHYHLRESPAAGACGRSPLAAFAEFRRPGWVAARPSDADMALLLMPSQPVSVCNNGIWVRGFSSYYWSEQLEPLRCNRAKVVYRYNPDKPGEIYVFTANNDRFLAVATPYIGMGISALAAHGSAEGDKLAAAIANSRHHQRQTMEELRHVNGCAASVLLGAHQDAGRALGLLDSDQAAMRHRAAIVPPHIRLIEGISVAAEEGKKLTAEAAEGAEKTNAADLLDSDPSSSANSAPSAVDALELLSQNETPTDGSGGMDLRGGDPDAGPNPA